MVLLILNVPAGAYTVKATYIGYITRVSGVRVVTGLNTAGDFSLSKEWLKEMLYRL